MASRTSPIPHYWLLRFRFTGYDLDSPHEFQALSYAWGNPIRGPLAPVKRVDGGEIDWDSRSNPILCNEIPVYIPQNLFDAVSQIWQSGHLGLLWIDLLCINQNDLTECGAQVSLMGDIFVLASQVICWLERRDEQSSRFLNCMRSLRLLSMHTSIIKTLMTPPNTISRIQVCYIDCNLHGFCRLRWVCRHLHWSTGSRTAFSPQEFGSKDFGLCRKSVWLDMPACCVGNRKFLGRTWSSLQNSLRGVCDGLISL
jgi:hypothetical protein